MSRASFHESPLHLSPNHQHNASLTPSFVPILTDASGSVVVQTHATDSSHPSHYRYERDAQGNRYSHPGILSSSNLLSLTCSSSSDTDSLSHSISQPSSTQYQNYQYIDCSSRGWNGIGFTLPISPDCFRCRTSSPSPLYGIMHVTPREANDHIQFNTSTQLIHNASTQTTCGSTKNRHLQRILRHSTSKSHCSRHQVTTDSALFITLLHNLFTLNI